MRRRAAAPVANLATPALPRACNQIELKGSSKSIVLVAFDCNLMARVSVPPLATSPGMTTFLMGRIDFRDFPKTVRFRVMRAGHKSPAYLC